MLFQKWNILTILFICIFVFSASHSPAIENDDCLMCHEELEVELKDVTTQTWTFNLETYSKSIHNKEGLSCIDCHRSIEDIPHKEELEDVDCSLCHYKEAEVYDESLHGQAVKNNDPLAPHCWDCHSKHDILARKNPESNTNPIHIPEMCGACHAENAPVAKERNISQHHILQHYAESIHGEGLKRKGLTVTAVCNSCHTAHHVLPHTDKRSSISRDNIVGTCTQCHALIEQVHRKVIEGKLWEDEPHKIPVCIDCHQPHEARKVYYDEGVSDKDCLACHAHDVNGATHTLKAVDTNQLSGSTHANVRCAQCHTGTSPNHTRPCDTVVPKVDCSICHAEQVEQHNKSMHGQLAAKGDKDAPVCLDCHSGHGTQSQKDSTSPTFPKNVPELCGECHRDGEKAATRRHSAESQIVSHYTMSIHGKGLLKSGLVVTAMCTDCHTAHMPLPISDPESSVNRKNIADTCGRCHFGIEEKFNSSIHSPLVSKTEKELPVCSDCHNAHNISRTDIDDFVLNIMETCGYCHKEIATTYFDTYHGKVSKLGSVGAAKCHNCHGAHDVLPVNDPESHLSRQNIVATCGQCHPGSNKRFTGYLTHATHHDPVKYPILFITFWAMTALLCGTFLFFGIHTIIWLPRSFAEMRKKKSHYAETGEQPFVMRFERITRQLHFILILSFFGLALSGMALKFSYMTWALWLSKILGGFRTMGIIHRFCAVVMIIIFIVHLFHIFSKKRRSGLSWKEFLTGSSSLLPTLKDLKEFWQSIKWFVRLGPKPEYGKWTYWEKFDYFAVFWGIAIIGSTGFLLWFPEFFTRLLPGWLINVATIIHSDEALLAVGFIFTIHFFNTHFRPDKFPMDKVMFTGSMPLEEFKEDKKGQYKEVMDKGKLEKMFVPPAAKEFSLWAAIFGTCAVIIGFTLVLFIIWSMLFGYGPTI